MAEATQRLVELDDGVSLNIAEVGSGHPLILLHGGPGLDHHELHPWLDPLAGAGFRMIYVDMRGQGGSERVDPQSLTIQVFAQDVDRLARALELEQFSLYGHSFGAIVVAGARARARHGRPVRDLQRRGVQRGAGGRRRARDRPVRAGRDARADQAVVGRRADRVDGGRVPRHHDVADAVPLLGDGRRLPHVHREGRDRLLTGGAGALREERLRRLRVGRPPALDLQADAGRDGPLRPHVHGGALPGDPRRGGRIAAGGDREGGAHDAHRAAQGADGRGAASGSPTRA